MKKVQILSIVATALATHVVFTNATTGKVMIKAIDQRDADAKPLAKNVLLSKFKNLSTSSTESNVLFYCTSEVREIPTSTWMNPAIEEFQPLTTQNNKFYVANTNREYAPVANTSLYFQNGIWYVISAEYVSEIETLIGSEAVASN